MKKLTTIISALFLGLVLSVSFSFAQDYKHPYGLIDKKGNVTDPTGKHLGSVTTDGKIKDASGKQIAQIDAQGNAVDPKTGQTLGRAPKNGTFVYYFPENKKDSLVTSYPMNGTCEVKNSKGEIVVIVHENYKHNGACAYHCLGLHKRGEYMKMK